MLILEIAGGVALGLLLLGLLGAALSYKSPATRAFEERQLERLVSQSIRTQHMDNMMGLETARRLGPSDDPMEQYIHFLKSL